MEESDDYATSRTLERNRLILSLPDADVKIFTGSLPAVLADDVYWQMAMRIAMVQDKLKAEEVYVSYFPGHDQISISFIGSKTLSVYIENLCEWKLDEYEYRLMRLYRAPLNFEIYLLRKPKAPNDAGIDAVWLVSMG